MRQNPHEKNTGNAVTPIGRAFVALSHEKGVRHAGRGAWWWLLRFFASQRFARARVIFAETNTTMASARQIRDEIMKMTIVVNSDPAQKEIYELSKKTKELSEANTGLSESLRQIEKERKKEETAINRYADKIDKLKFRLRENQTATIEQVKALKKQQDQYNSSSKEFQNIQARIDALRSRSKANTNSLEASITSLVSKQKPLSDSYDKNSQAVKKLTTEINGNKTAINEYKTKLKELNDGLSISQMTMAQLKKEAALLRTNLSNMVPGSEASRALEAQLQAVNARMAEVRTGAGQTQSSFRGLADTFNHYQGIVFAATAVFAGFALSVQQVIERNNKLVDAQTAVAKTVGMTKQEVDDLTKSFSAFDTRTARIDLLKIAETGGRLGIGKEQIKEFVREVDKANVALGDGFAGGVAAVTDTLGKLKNLYGETKDLDMATAINQIGSAMNELGAAGAASEENIGDFALRVGALPAKLKPTIAESLALGAAFEESGINAERAGTAYASFVRTAANNSKAFAEVMNISVKEVEAMMNKDPLEFFLKFSEGAKGLDTTQLAKMLDYLKLNDQYVISAMGAASENTDRFRRSIDLSNKSLAEATSLTDEFNKVNNNTSAIFDKVQKKFLGMFTSQAVADTLNYLISTFGKFIGAIEDSEGNVTSFRNGIVFLIKVFAVMIATLVTYNLATGVYNTLMTTAIQRVVGLTVVERARNAVMLIANGLATLYRASLWLLAAGYSLLTGNVAGATFAMRGFTAALAANPLGAVLTLVTLAASAYFAFANKTKEAAKAQRTLNDVMREGTEAAAQEISKLEVLYKTATNVKLSTEERLKAVQQLKKEFPSYFAQIDDEIIMNGKAADSYRALRDAIIASARSRAAEAELEKREGERFKRSDSWKEEYKTEIIELARLKKSRDEIEKAGRLNGNRRMEMNTRIAMQEQKLRDLEKKRFQDRLNDYKQDEQYIDAIAENKRKSALYDKDREGGVEASSSYTVPEKKEKKKKGKSAEAEARRRQREKEQYDKMMRDWLAKGESAEALARQIELDISDARLDAMEEGHLKEMAQLSIQQERKLAEIDKKKYQESDFKGLQAALAKAKGKDKNFLEALKINWMATNERLEEEKMLQTAIYANRREGIQYKYEQKHLDKQNALHETALGHLKRQQNEELATYQTLADLKEGLRGRMDEKERVRIRTWAEGKEALNKVYQKRELELQVAHLEAMVKLYEGLDLGILTPEQREQVMKFIDEAGNKIAEFRAKMAGENQTEKGPKKFSERGSTGDVLGMSVDDWHLMFTNIQNGTDALGTMMAAVGALQNAFGAYYKYVEANEKRQLQQMEAATNRKKNTLKKQLLEGQINQETYKQQTIQAEQELEKKKAEIALKQAKREKQMAIASTLMNTAQAIMGIWAQFPKFDFGATAAIMSGVVGALGAVQIATIMSQPLPTAEGFEQGFGMEYPIVREQDGKRFNVRRERLRSGLVDRPTHFIAGENRKVEMVIDNPTWTRYPNELKRAIHSANARAKGFETGFNTAGTAAADDETMMMVVGVLQRTNETLDNIQRYGIMAKIEKNALNGKHSYEMQKEFLDLNNKNKH